MNLKVGFRSSRRQWVRSILYILFLTVISFGFLSNLLEYQMMYQQVEHAAAYYRPVGRIWPLDKTEMVTTEGVELVNDSEYILYSNANYYMFATLEDNYSPRLMTDLSDLNANNICYFTGTLVSKKLEKLDEHVSIPDNDYMGRFSEIYTFIVDVDTIFSALPEYLQEEDSIRVLVYGNGEPELLQEYENMEVGGSYLYKTRAIREKNGRVGSIYYGFHMRPEDPIMMYCREDFSDVSQDERALIEKDIACQQTNIRGVTINSISDVQFSDVYMNMFFLVEGRWVDHRDEEENRMVCTIHQDLANMRGYEIGDSVSVEVYRAHTGAIPGYLTELQVGKDIYENWEQVETITRTYEVVGIYSDTQYGYYNACVFVPPSSIPQEWRDQWWDERVRTGYYHYFVLEHPKLISKFMEEYESQLLEMGYTVVFEDNGWDKFQEASDPMLQSALTGVIVFGILMVSVLILLAILAIQARRRELAIMRALGVTERSTGLNCFLPLLMIGMVGFTVGGGVSWYYVGLEAADLLSGLSSFLGSEAGLDLSVWYLVLVIGVIVFLWGVLLLTLTLIQLKKPILVQLQGGSGHGRKYRQQKVVEQSGSDDLTGNRDPVDRDDQQKQGNVISRVSGVEKYQNDGGKHGISTGLLVRLIRNYAIRTPGRTGLLLVILSGFLVVLSAMDYYIQYNDRMIEYLYSSVEVKGSIIRENTATIISNGGVIPRWVVEHLQEHEGIKDLYLETGSSFEVKHINNGTEQEIAEQEIINVRGLPSWEGSTLQASGVVIEFLEGYDESFLTSRDIYANTWIVLDGTVMDKYGLKLGDEIVGLYGQPLLIAELRYTIIGRMVDVQGDVDVEMIVRNREMEMQCVEKKRFELYYSTADFTMKRSQNTELDVFQEEIDTLLATDNAKKRARLVCVLDDLELMMAVEPLEQGNRLMEILYPILLAVSVLVSAGVAILLMLPRRKEAAIMRVLGTRKRHSMMIFVGGHMLTCLLGILVALIGMWWVAPWLYKWVWSSVLICIVLSLTGSLVGSLIGAWTLVSGKPLELLQVKE